MDDIKTEIDHIPTELSDSSVSTEDYLFYVLKDLDPCVKNRIMDLRKLQLQHIHEEINYYKELLQLQMKYANIYKRFFKNRFGIINGVQNFPLNEQLQNETNEEMLRKDLKENKNKGDKLSDDAKSNPVIPNFWLTVLLNSKFMSKLIYKRDKPILKNLKDLRLKYNSENQMDFTLEFHFEPNEYFSNTILTKDYWIKCELDPKEPYDFDGPEIVGCTGCHIDWKEGKNPTLVTVKKRKRNKVNGAFKVIEKTLHKKSYFEFFNPPNVEENSEMDEDIEELLAKDFEIGLYIKEKIIPRAVFFYTKEIIEESDESEYDSSSE